jgi:hypothetical protein
MRLSEEKLARQYETGPHTAYLILNRKEPEPDRVEAGGFCVSPRRPCRDAVSTTSVAFTWLG